MHGPIPADALIPAAVKGKWNMVIACYHDQGHAPFKAVYGDDGVNITVGLPVVRVSVDHGTAFDIAGQGIAREASLVLSMRRAAALAPGWDHVWRTAQKKLLLPTPRIGTMTSDEDLDPPVPSYLEDIELKRVHDGSSLADGSG